MAWVNERSTSLDVYGTIPGSKTNYFFLFQGGGGLVYQLRKSYSLTDLGNQDELDDGSNPMGMAGHGRFRQLPQITDITGNFFVPGLWSV